LIFFLITNGTKKQYHEEAFEILGTLKLHYQALL
jgi:hypothetical protein